MLFEFGRKQISIETNPTSNYLIGTFQKYANHPIKIFYNLGLETDPIAISKSPQISVSINTDDQGIFSTSLENEYAFLAISLLKERDNDGKLKYNSAQIYDWLYRIMKMGNNQSFT
jgi:adenosine deaminase